MEQDRRITYTVKHPGRLAVVLAASVGTILLAVAWTLYLDRLNRRTADLAAYTTLTRAAETVSASLDLDGLLLQLMGHMSLKDAAREASEALKLPKKQVYTRALELKNE